MATGVQVEAAHYYLEMIEPEKAVPIIDFEHKKVHLGKNFHTFHRFHTVPSGQTRHFVFETPDQTNGYHVVPDIQFYDGGTIALYEDSQVTVNEGNVISIFNSNRKSATTSGVVFSHTPSVITDLGTKIDESFFINGSGANRIVVSSVSRNEWVFKPNTQYVWVFTSGSNNTGVEILLNWYEER